MMFSLTFAVFIIINIGINGLPSGINNKLLGDNPSNGYAFGKLRLTDDGKNEVIAINSTEIIQLNQDQVPVIQPLPSPCTGVLPLTKLSYPKDKTKYIQCRDEFHYDIFTCPNGGEYNQQTNSCDLIVPMTDACGQERPCLNDGQCLPLPNSGFKCVCPKHWTGERCETGLNSCAKKPCGPNADCRPLKTIETEQDYACVCNGIGGYGLNCQEAVPDPCLTSGGEQFFPFIFSQHAYIQCDGDLLHFQPCGPLLYWNQEEKICDRKRQPKVNLPALIAKLRTQFNNGNQPETTTPFSLTQTARDIERKAQELAIQLSQAIDMNQMGLLSKSNNQQWTNSQVDVNLKQPQNIQYGQNQIPSQNNNQPWTLTLTDTSNGNLNLGQSQIKQNNLQQQNFQNQNQNQGFTSQQSFNQLSDVNSQNNQRFIVQPQQDQKSQTLQGQTRFLDQIQPSLSDGTGTFSQNGMNLQGFQNSNIRDQQQSWQSRPATQITDNQTPQLGNFNTQLSQTLTGQPQTWLSSVQNQGRILDQNQQRFVETTTSAPTILRLQGFQNSNIRDQQLSWQDRPTGQMTENQAPQTGNFNAQMTTLTGQPQTWQSSQILQNQGRLPDRNQATFLETTTLAPTMIRLQGFQNPQTIQLSGNQLLQPSNFMNQNAQSSMTSSTSGQNSQLFQNPQQLPLTNGNTFSSQTVLNQQRLPTVNSQSSFNLNNGQIQQGIQTPIRQDNQQQFQQNFAQQNPRLIGQTWQGSQSLLNQQPFTETTTALPNIIHLQGFQPVKSQDQSLSWQNTLSSQPIQTDFTKLSLNQPTVLQPQQWTSSNLQSILPLTSQTNQLGLNQQSKGTGVQMTATFDQTQPWSNTKQFSSQGNLMTGINDMKLQNNQAFVARPLTTFQTQGLSQTGPLLAYTYDTTTMASRVNNWQPMSQQYSSQAYDQRKPLDSVPILSSGSWQTRS